MNAKFLLVFSLVLLSGRAHAQVGLKSKILSLEQLPLATQLKLDPRLPALPVLEANQPARLKISVLNTYRGPVYQLEVVQKNRADVIEAIVLALGAQSMIDPVINRQYYPAAVFRALSLEELLPQVTGGFVEMWKSSSGIYFFAHTYPPEVQEMIDRGRIPAPSAKQPPGLPSFNRNEGNLQKIVPEPHWGKIPFNGRDVYVIPLPELPKAAPKSD